MNPKVPGLAQFTGICVLRLNQFPGPRTSARISLWWGLSSASGGTTQPDCKQEAWAQRWWQWAGYEVGGGRGLSSKPSEEKGGETTTPKLLCVSPAVNIS